MTKKTGYPAFLGQTNSARSCERDKTHPLLCDNFRTLQLSQRKASPGVAQFWCLPAVPLDACSFLTAIPQCSNPVFPNRDAAAP